MFTPRQVALKDEQLKIIKKQVDALRQEINTHNSEMSRKYATQTDLKNNYLNKADAVKQYQPKGSYLVGSDLDKFYESKILKLDKDRALYKSLPMINMNDLKPTTKIFDSDSYIQIDYPTFIKYLINFGYSLVFDLIKNNHMDYLLPYEDIFFYEDNTSIFKIPDIYYTSIFSLIKDIYNLPENKRSELGIQSDIFEGVSTIYTIDSNNKFTRLNFSDILENIEWAHIDQNPLFINLYTFYLYNVLCEQRVNNLSTLNFIKSKKHKEFIRSSLSNLPYLNNGNKYRCTTSDLRSLLLSYYNLNKSPNEEVITSATPDSMLKIFKSSTGNMFTSEKSSISVYNNYINDNDISDYKLTEHMSTVDTTLKSFWTTDILKDDKIYYLSYKEEIVSKIFANISKNEKALLTKINDVDKKIPQSFESSLQNSKLFSEMSNTINSLKSQNEKLLNQLNSLNTKYNEVVNENTSLSKEIENINEQIRQINKNIIFNDSNSDKKFTAASRGYKMNYYDYDIKVDTDPIISIPTDSYVDEEKLRKSSTKLDNLNKKITSNINDINSIKDIASTISKK